MYKYILFDLDGTLTDPGLGITNAVMHALKKFNIEVPDRSELYKFIGPPLLESFEKYYGMTEEESQLALQYYREYFKPYGLYENTVYDGIEKVLSALKSQGRKLILATSKPEPFAVEILRHFGLDKHFDFVAGATMDEKRVRKADVIAYALESCGITELSEAIMIGDREHDVLGAKEVGLQCIGVLYGYGDLEELEKAGANYIAKTPEDILKVLSGNE